MPAGYSSSRGPCSICMISCAAYTRLRRRPVISSRCVLHGLGVERGPSNSPPQGASDGPPPAYPLPRPPGRSSETVLFCLIDDAYTTLNPQGAYRYETLKHLSDSEVIALALFQQLRGVESERSFLRDAQRFFSHLFPGVVGLYPSSFNRRLRRSSGAFWNLCGERSSPSWWEILRPCSWTRRCWKSPIRARLSSQVKQSG